MARILGVYAPIARGPACAPAPAPHIGRDAARSAPPASPHRLGDLPPLHLWPEAPAGDPARLHRARPDRGHGLAAAGRLGPGTEGDAAAARPLPPSGLRGRADAGRGAAGGGP